MKILTGKEIKVADQYTCEQEPIESINLMERAAEVIAQWIGNNISQETPLCFFIGKGNNGGDGLAVARMLYHVDYTCCVYLAFPKEELSEDCRFNLERLPDGVQVLSGTELAISDECVIIDALLGSGVHGEMTEPMTGAIELINTLPFRVVSIDLPSGMLTEYGNAERTIVQAETTLVLEYPKLAMMLPEAGEYAGKVVILPIDLDQNYMEQSQTPYIYLDEVTVCDLMEPRAKFGHKGTYGHALLVCGAEGMTGAAVMATGAALRSGCGMVTVHLPREERAVIHVTNPSAIVSCDSSKVFSHLPHSMERYNAVGTGCGLGRGPESVRAMKQLLQQSPSMVIDADALSIIGSHRELYEFIPAGSILTPHLGELKGLVDEWTDEEDKMSKVTELAASLQCYVIVKGAHSMICTPDGRKIFNSTGNSGMSKAGSGDVLTGLLTGLLARGYSPESAAIIGIYIHGLAGDKAAEFFGHEGMNAPDMIDFLAEALAQYE